eukprot:s261_g27.t1
MAGPIDSEAHFEARASEYGVPLAFLTALKRQGISTVGHLAFAIFRPGAEFNEREFDNWTREVNNNVPLTMGAAAAVRRLHYECEVIMTSSIRASVESADSSSPKSIPYAEKTARMDQIRERLQGLNIQGHGEPSHSLLDECGHQSETRTLRYIEPNRCTSRENEVTSGRTDKKLKLDSGSLSIKESKTVPDENVSTTYNLAACLRRRGIAYDFANLISFRAHELYVEKLLRHLSIEPPPSFQAVTLSQKMKADKEVFMHMAHNVKDIRPVADVKPLDEALETAVKDYNTAFHLMPLPKHSVKEDTVPRRANYEPYPATGQHKGKGKGKSGKGGKSFGSNAAPKGYSGCVGRDAKNRPICFDFNLSSCSKAPAGGACPKGRHVCFKGGCFKAHPFKEGHPDEIPNKE